MSTSRASSRRPILDVVVVDDCPLILHGLTSMLQPFSVQVRSDGEGDFSRDGCVRIALYDPSGNSRHRAARVDVLLRDRAYDDVVIYSADPPRDLLREALTRGCAAFVDKRETADVLLETLLTVAGRWTLSTEAAVGNRPRPRGSWPGEGMGLSRRESEVICLITEGLTNVDIGARTALSVNTIKSYIRSAYRKIGVTRRTEAVRWGIEHGAVRGARPWRGDASPLPGPGSPHEVRTSTVAPF